MTCSEIPEANKSDLDDDMRPEYDLRKLKMVGRGIYAERLRSGNSLVEEPPTDTRESLSRTTLDSVKPQP